MENTLNLKVDNKTLEACLKTINNIGSTIHQNICTGEAVTIQWGTLDWALALFFAAILIAMIIMLTTIITGDY